MHFPHQIVDCPLCRAHIDGAQDYWMIVFRQPSHCYYFKHGHYRSDYCYFCLFCMAYALSQLPWRNLIISAIAQLKFLLFNLHHYHNVASLPKAVFFSLSIYQKKHRGTFK